MTLESVLPRFPRVSHPVFRWQVVTLRLNAVIVDVDNETKKAVSIQRIAIPVKQRPDEVKYKGTLLVWRVPLLFVAF